MVEPYDVADVSGIDFEGENYSDYKEYRIYEFEDFSDNYKESSYEGILFDSADFIEHLILPDLPEDFDSADSFFKFSCTPKIDLDENTQISISEDTVSASVSSGVFSYTAEIGEDGIGGSISLKLSAFGKFGISVGERLSFPNIGKSGFSVDFDAPAISCSLSMDADSFARGWNALQEKIEKQDRDLARRLGIGNRRIPMPFAY